MLDHKTKTDDTLLYDELQAELEAARRELEETRMLLDQSRQELERLTQRNAAVSARLQQVQAGIGSLPPSEVKAAYDAALEAQGRLFVLRGRLDQLQAEESRLGKLVSWLERLAPLVSAPKSKTHSEAVGMVEMVIQAQEAERARLARQMHDEPAQALSNFILQAEIAQRLFDLDPVKAREELNALKTAAGATFQKVRDYIFELRPMMLDDLGLGPTLARYAETVRERSGADVRLACRGLEGRLEPYQEVMLFRAVQELVGNALRHGGASEVKVQVDVVDPEVRVWVEDNGKGFEAREAFDKGLGLKLIRDRVEMLGGSLDVHTSAGQGSRIAFRMPALRSRVIA
jgi:two-component system, NarL family, sensor histidine kinase DegS